MLSWSPSLIALLRDPNVRLHFLLKLTTTSPAIKLYFSDIDGGISDGGLKRILGTVLSWGSGIQERLDPFQRRVQAQDIAITLSNADYRRVAGATARLSDELGQTDYINQPAQIYLWHPSITAIASAALIFDGIMQPVIITDDYVKLRLTDSAWIDHKLIPEDYVNTTDFPDAPEESIGLPLPIVYGAFAVDSDFFVGGLSEGVRIKPRKWCFSANEIKALTQVWLLDSNLDVVARIKTTQYTKNMNDSGRVTVEIDDPYSCQTEAWLYPATAVDNNNYPPSGVIEGFVDNPERAIDKDFSTFALLRIPDVAEQGLLWDAQMSARFRDYGYGGEIDTAASSIQIQARFKILQPTYLSVANIQYGATIWDLLYFCGSATGGGNNYLDDTGQTWTVNDPNLVGSSLEILSGVGSGQTRTISSNTATRLTVSPNWTTNPASGSVYTIYKTSGFMTYDIGGPSPAWPSADGNALKAYIGAPDDNNFDAMNLYEFRLYFLYAAFLLTKRAPASIVRRPRTQPIQMHRPARGVIEPGSRLFAECEGRKFGSWIDDGGRSNSYNEGDLIENPAGIIEDVLRTLLSFASADIDTTAFDNALGQLGSWDMATTLKERIHSRELIEQICREAKMIFTHSITSGATLFVWKSSYSAVDTLNLLEVAAGAKARGLLKLEMGRLEWLVNRFLLYFGFRQQDDDWLEYLEDNNTTSQSNYNTTNPLEIYSTLIPNATVADMLKGHFLSIGISGYWSSLHTLIHADCVSMEYAKWEIGEVIDISSDVDVYLKNFNQTWTSSRLLIIGRKVTPTTVSFTFLQIAGGEPT